MNARIKNILKSCTAALEASEKDFKALYEISFNNIGNIAEDSDGFRTRTYTYGEVRERIEEVSCALYQKIGASHGYVALEMENSVDWIVAFWAILRSGNKPYLVNCRHPKALADSALKTLGIRYILSSSQGALNGEYIEFSTLKTEQRFAGDFENEIALSTSATSLKEVICFYTGAQLCAQISNVKYFVKQYPEITYSASGTVKNLAFLPFYHIFGLIAVYFWFTFFGQTIVFLKDYATDTILKTCKKHQVTHIFAVPLLWHSIENAIWKKAAKGGEKKLKKLNKGLKFCTALQNIFPHFGMKAAQGIMHEITDELFGRSVSFCINGGSYIRNSALQLLNGIGYNLHNGYGMSEIGISSVELRTRPKHKNLNSIGKPFASVDYKINEDGILTVKGSSICTKMLIDGEAQNMDEYFVTGDTMETDADGYYYIHGRVGDMIIGENGENINPDVLEQNFRLPGANNFCVLGLEENGKKIVAMVVELSKYMSGARRNALLDKILETNNTLPITSRVQKLYCTTDALCSAGAVKVSRKYLLRAIENGTVVLSDFKKTEVADTEEIVYSDALLQTVKRIVAQALDLDENTLDIHANIMLDYGADSMQYFSILTALANEFSITSPEKSEFYYTVHEFCQYIERHI